MESGRHDGGGQADADGKENPPAGETERYRARGSAAIAQAPSHAAPPNSFAPSDTTTNGDFRISSTRNLGLPMCIALHINKLHPWPAIQLSLTARWLHTQAAAGLCLHALGICLVAPLSAQASKYAQHLYACPCFPVRVCACPPTVGSDLMTRVNAGWFISSHITLCVLLFFFKYINDVHEVVFLPFGEIWLKLPEFAFYSLICFLA